MPLSKYFNAPGNGKPGEGSAVMASMQKRYGASKGQRVFYATVNRMKKGSPAERAAQSGAPARSAARDTTHQAVARRLRKAALKRGNQQRGAVEKRHPFRNEPKGGPIKGQPGSYPKGK